MLLSVHIMAVPRNRQSPRAMRLLRNNNMLRNNRMDNIHKRTATTMATIKEDTDTITIRSNINSL